MKIIILEKSDDQSAGPRLQGSRQFLRRIITVIRELYFLLFLSVIYDCMCTPTAQLPHRTEIYNVTKIVLDAEQNQHRNSHIAYNFTACYNKTTKIHIIVCLFIQG